MAQNEIEQVLANWIAQATAPLGQLAEGVDPAAWIARRFLVWWWPTVERPLSDAVTAVDSAFAELNRLGGWENQQLAEVMHELVHAKDALAELRASFSPPEHEQRSS